jgi:RNA polymerase sigma-70 factor (sigma-E family)
MRAVDVTAGERDAVTTADAALGSASTQWDADRAVTVMYGEHYGPLVRMAALLIGNAATAEAVVQDSFVAMHGAWRRLRSSEKALPYLRQCVVNRSRSVLRHRIVIGRDTPKPEPGRTDAQREVLPPLEHAVVRALRALPLREREALVLTYYGELTEAQAASAMGITARAVKSHTARAVEALRAVVGTRT